MRVGASSLGAEIDLRGEYCQNMLKAGLGSYTEVNRALLFEFKIQKDVEM